MRGWFREDVQPKDHLLLYFSSHGATISGRDGAIGVIIPHDVAFVPNSLAPVLSGPTLTEILATNPSKNILVVVDACHSGRLTTAKAIELNSIPKVLLYPGMPDSDLDADLFHAGARATKDLPQFNFGYLAACTQRESANASPDGSILTRALTNSWQKLKQEHMSASLSNAHPLIVKFIQALNYNDQHPEMEGAPELLAADWFRSRNAGEGPPPNPPSDSTGKVWTTLENILQHSSGSLEVKVSRESYVKGELLNITVTPGREGYLYVISVGEGDEKPGVLLPNDYQQENHFSGEPVLVPQRGAEYQIRQRIPANITRQRVLVVAVLTDSPNSLKDLTSGVGPFKNFNLPAEATRSPFVEAASASPSGYLAGKATYVIKAKP